MQCTGETRRGLMHLGGGQFPRRAVGDAALGPDPFAQCRVMRVIRIQHREAQSGELEQARLGMQIRRHIKVIIKVVAAKVGEDRGIRHDAAQPPLIETMRGGLKADHRIARLAQFGQGALQAQGIRGGQDRLGIGRATRLADPEGTNHRTRPAELPPGLTEQVGAGGLAVGAGDGADRQRPARLAVEARRNRPDLVAQIRDREARDREFRSGVIGFHEHRAGTGAHRRVKMPATVILQARAGEEQLARPQTAGVQSKAADLRVRARDLRHAFKQAAQFDWFRHHFRYLAPGGYCSGASDRRPMRRTPGRPHPRRSSVCRAGRPPAPE